MTNIKYPDLFSLDEEKIREIETLCWKRGHLGEESLLDRIVQDLEQLKKFGLTKEDIYNNHRNMKLTYKYLHETWKPNKEEKQKTYDINNILPKNLHKRNWCLSGREEKCIMFNGQKLVVFSYGYKGFEQCPIATVLLNDSKHLRGCWNWIIINYSRDVYVWVPDLLPKQINAFGFFQSPSSLYRFDLERYVKTMGLDLQNYSPIPRLILPTYKLPIWEHCSSCSNSNFKNPNNPRNLIFYYGDPEKRKKTMIGEFDTQRYYALYHYDKYEHDKKCLYILPKDKKWITNNRNKKVSMFGAFLNISTLEGWNYVSYRKTIKTYMEDKKTGKTIEIFDED